MRLQWMSRSLCLTQVDITIVHSTLFSDLSIRCNLSQNVLVQECIIFVIQEFLFSSCTSHMSVIPSVVLGPQGGDEMPHLMPRVVGSSRPIHYHTFLTKPRIYTSSQKDKSQQVPVHTLSHFGFVCPMQRCQH